jgi:hypothetical protein
MYPKTKLELSPRLKWGVGRGKSLNKIMRRTGIVFVLLTIGLAINATRLVYNNTTNASNNPRVLGVTDSVNPESLEDRQQFIEHRVKKGETLFSVSQQYNISWTTIATLNKLDAPFSLTPGQSVKIPKQ